MQKFIKKIFPKIKKPFLIKKTNYSFCTIKPKIILTKEKKTLPKIKKKNLIKKITNKFCTKKPEEVILTKEQDSWSYELKDEKLKGISQDISGNYMIIYTCKVCDTRQSRSFTKNAYKNGIVILKCEGCKGLHLIADNLGWFQDGKINIEDIVKDTDEEIVKVNAEGDLKEFLISKLGKREGKSGDYKLSGDQIKGDEDGDK